jgi:integrase
MGSKRPAWQADLSRSFKRHREGRPGWAVEVHRERLRIISTELPPKRDEADEDQPRRRAVTMETPPGPATAAAALAEACRIYDEVTAGSWEWPRADGIPKQTDERRLAAPTLKRLVEMLRAEVVGERVSETTWTRIYKPALERLIEEAARMRYASDRDLLRTVLKQWQPQSRSRQMAHDRYRQLWRMAGWTWPSEILAMRGNGKAKVNPEGVPSFTDAEISELRSRVMRSRHLQPEDLVAWDLLAVFGLRPVELQALQLQQRGRALVAIVSREKVSSKGRSGARTVPAVPPSNWPPDCHDLFSRWAEHGIPQNLTACRSPGEVLAQQLKRLKRSKPFNVEIAEELTPYGLRHAFALRLGQDIGLHIREAAQLMGHSPQVHLQTYGRRLDQPGLIAKVQARIMESRQKNASIL